MEFLLGLSRADTDLQDLSACGTGNGTRLLNIGGPGYEAEGVLLGISVWNTYLDDLPRAAPG